MGATFVKSKPSKNGNIDKKNAFNLNENENLETCQRRGMSTNLDFKESTVTLKCWFSV